MHARFVNQGFVLFGGVVTEQANPGTSLMHPLESRLRRCQDHVSVRRHILGPVGQHLGRRGNMLDHGKCGDGVEHMALLRHVRLERVGRHVRLGHQQGGRIAIDADVSGLVAMLCKGTVTASDIEHGTAHEPLRGTDTLALEEGREQPLGTLVLVVVLLLGLGAIG